MKLMLVTLLGLFLIFCNRTHKSQEQRSFTVSRKQLSGDTAIQVPDTNKTSSNNKVRNASIQDTVYTEDSITILQLQHDSIYVKGRLRGYSDHQIFQLETRNSRAISIHLEPEDIHANVRINQLSLPDDRLDGPFGKDLNYPLKAAGKLKIIIGENMMAEGNWKGNYLLKIKLVQ